MNDALLPKRPLGLGSPLQMGAGVFLVLAGLALVASLNGYYVFVLAGVALMAIVGIGLNVLLGLAGQVSLGHVGFYAIGAYGVAILGTRLGLNFWISWPIATAIAGAVGALLALPALRVRGPYLAMVTIAFGFIVEHAIVEAGDLTGGQNGIMGIPAPVLPGVQGGDRAVAMIAIVAAGVLFALFAWLSRGSWGAALRAVRDSETAAESIGINPLVVRTAAFAMSAATAGMAGGLFAPLSGFIAPSTFGFGQSILFVLAVIVGGAGSIAGPLVGAFVVVLLPELLSGLEEYRLLFFGVMLLLVIWVAPDGAVGLVRQLGAKLRRKPTQAPTGMAAPRTPRGEAQPKTAAVAGLPRAAASPTRLTLAPAALRAEGLTMQFGGVRAVHELGFDAAAGRITSLIGPNGAGKTTALNVLSGFYKPTSGGFRLGERPLAGLSAYAIARAGIARTYQTSQLFGSLGVEDNVALALGRGQLGPLFSARHFRDAAVRERARALLDFCGWSGAGDTLASALPHVDRRLVEIARALATDPQFLLLDEPAAGLSREDKERLGTLLQRIAAAGIGVLVVEHDMELVMSISDHVVVLDAGQRLAQGAPNQVQADPRVQQAYLGQDMGAAVAPRSPLPAGAAELLGVGRLTAGYGAEPVLRDIDLRVRQGEVVALLGANGAGKSTLMRSLAGLHRPTSGGIHLEGDDISARGAEYIVARGLVLVPEGRQVFPELSVVDNIRLGAFLHPQGREEGVEAVFKRFPRLRERAHQRAALLSGGEQQMLAIARALMSRPRILLLDEPSLGLAPKIIAELFATLDSLAREGLTLVVVDQMASLALALAHNAYVVERGRIVAQGPAAHIASDGTLARAYLNASATSPPSMEEEAKAVPSASAMTA